MQGPEGSGYFTITADFSNIIGVTKTVATLQVVSNPILERTFTAPNGTSFPNPIHDQVFQSLADLQADLVRYVPWYPYPRIGVAELDPPIFDADTQEIVSTSWNFGDHIMPMLEDFMDAVYGENHSVVLNFSTQPCWLFANGDGKPLNCSYPDAADQTDFAYLRGSRANLIDPTARTMADYYGRLLSYLVRGVFRDEAGNVITGGPRYDLSRAKGHVWEVFNEVDLEHRYTPEQYIHDYDMIVPKIIQAVGGGDSRQKAPAFMGIGGALSPEFIAPFLNASLHQRNGRIVPPIDYFSQHFYANCANRTDPSTYSRGFFDGADKYVRKVLSILAVRDASDFPKARLALNELGVILPDDNNPSRGIDADIPPIYWNAAGAMFAYLFARLVPLGVDVLGQSQLVGSPKIPEWGITSPQFPSVAMIDWRTGLGTARYWVLKLILEEFQPGDRIVESSVVAANDETAASIAGGRKSEPHKGKQKDGIAALAVLQATSCFPGKKTKKILLVNKELSQRMVCFGTAFVGSTVVRLRIVDPLSVQEASAAGIRVESAPIDEDGSVCVNVEPFAVVVAFANCHHSVNVSAMVD